jgi:two-component system, OmpR family, phosphate regulon response regulator PhoB
MPDKQPLVLMIDDDEIFADTVKHRLDAEGMRMMRAANGEDGLQMLPGMIASGEKPDAILLDISMPGINGIEVLEKFHTGEVARGIPIALMSNFAREQDVEWAGKLGAVKTIDKTTVLPADIPDIIREMIKK